MKKILYLSPSLIPSQSANSIHVMQMCAAFTRAGYKCFLFALDGSKSSVTQEDDFLYYGLKEKFRILKFNNSGRFKKLRRFIYLFVQIITVRPDIIYSRNLELSRWALFMSKKPQIFELHSLVNEEKLYSLINSGRLKFLVVISASLKNNLINNFVINIPIIVAHDGVDLEKFNNIHKVKATCSEIKNIGYIGSLYKGRGIEIIIELSKKITDKNFIVIGGKNEEIAILKSDNDFPPNLKFYGYVSQSEIIKYYKIIDVFLMPYQYKVAVSGNTGNTVEFMSPLKMFEYLACGKPIVSSDIPVLREVLINELNCLMVPPDDLTQWEKAINRILDDDALSEFLCNNAYKTSLKYSWDRRVNKILGNI